MSVLGQNLLQLTYEQPKEQNNKASPKPVKVSRVQVKRFSNKVSAEFIQWCGIMQHSSRVIALSVRTKSQVQMSHLTLHMPTVRHHYAA